MQTHLTIALDTMGGDFGPRSTLPAAIKAVKSNPSLTLILCGPRDVLETELVQLNALNHPQLQIHHCPQCVSNEESAANALRTKRNSSMRVALELVKDKSAQACVSAGNTGALLAMAHYVLKMLPGVKRPALITSMPTQTPKPVYLLDLGANISCDPEVLYQFALMGSVMAKEAQGTEKPKVSLLNIGSEEIKGHESIKETARLLSGCPHLNYIGYSEGSDIFSGKADVIVCDGFVGNVALKTCEGIAKLIMHKLLKAINKSLFSKLLGVFFFPIVKTLYRKVNPDQYNGASLIGLRGIVVKSHGNASVHAFKAAIDEAIRETERQIPEKIQTQLELYKREELETHQETT